MLETVTLTTEMLWVLGVLGFTVLLFASEIVRIDVAAIIVMVLLGLLTLVPGLENITDVQRLFDGFSSNAVMSIIAVMIIGAGLDKTGLMNRLAASILRVGGSGERAVMPLVSGTVGVISSFMQNVGAAALFLPVVSRIASQTGLSLSRLLMPMGFCAILGGTITMVGSSPLILLNDLIRNSNQVLPEAAQMSTFRLFDVTPIGLALLVSGIGYFMLVGRYVLPAGGGVGEGTVAGRTAAYFNRVYGLDAAVYEVRIPRDSALQGRRVDVLERASGVRIVAYYSQGNKRLAPPGDLLIDNGSTLAVMAGMETLKHFVDHYALELRPQLRAFADDLNHTKSGIAEVVIPPDSTMIDKTTRDLLLRTKYGLSALAIHRGGDTIQKELRELPLKAGDTIICHSSWENLALLESNRNVVIVTSGYPREELRPQKVLHALSFFSLALALVLFSDLPLAIALLVGATGMVLGGVLSMDEAYRAVSWRTVFLLGSLIPLGQSVESTGTAAWIAYQTLSLLDGVPAWVLQATVALLATVFTLVVSNVGATVLLVPLAVNIAIGAGADPAVFALTVAVSTSNSFLIPTHQVNALIMGPAGYTIKDFARAGGGMTLLFFVVSLVMLNVFY